MKEKFRKALCMKILHLSHTDIASDSRVLKEMQSLSYADNCYKLVGIGVKEKKSTKATKKREHIRIGTVDLKSREWTALPRPLRHACSLVELVFRMFFKGLREKPAVIHCHDTLVLPIGVLLKVFSGAQLVYDAHELESDRNGLTPLLKKMVFFVEKTLWKQIDALIVVSPSIEKWYMRHLGEKRSEIILNSPVFEDEENTNETTDYLRKHFSIPSDSRIFIYVGGLVKGRGIEKILDAFLKEGVTSSLVFLGYGVLADRLKELSQKHNNIFVHDAVAHEEVVEIVRSADVGMCMIENVSLSDYFCLPNKLFEYCFAGVPVLASDFPDIQETVYKYQLGKCCDTSAEAIYEAVREMENMEKLPEVNIEGLYELSWDHQEKKLAAFYRDIINTI
jgi:glycosyltransferase involved in cell wall biosynthesis